MNRFLKILFIVLIVRPLVLIILGLNIRGREKLPLTGPAVIAANHNSHLDTMVLFSLYPLSAVHKLRPVAASDYFMRNSVIAWFSQNVIGIIPIGRTGKANKDEIFSGCHEALDNDDIIIVFPEGTRGEPEQISKLKKGIFYLVKDRTDTQIVPLVTHGLGRALPRGEALLVPFNCDVAVGESLPTVNTSSELLALLNDSYSSLLKDCLTYKKIK